MATNDKYDRQLRLWGANGQQALGDTKVILVGASAAGTETLKNLVLPGIGSFCVVDDARVPSKADVASNFFLALSSTKSRAQVASEYLQELNPDVNGSFQIIVPSLSQIPDWKSVLTLTNESTLPDSKKLLVIASDLEPQVLERLSEVCASQQIPMVAVQSYGLIGVVRLQLTQPTALLDPKPTNAPPDLRLKTSFPGLDKMANSIDMQALENHQHGHVPYPILLLLALNEWKQQQSHGKVPSTFAEKQEFKALIKSKSRDYDKELNFREAVQNSYLAYTERDVVVPEHLDPTSSLGKLYQALQTFMAQHQGRPPLNGSIPDMTANTDWYVQLQQIYKEQAEDDLQEMIRLVGTDDQIPKDDVASFCANVYSVSQIQTTSIVHEWNQPPSPELLDDLKMALMDPYEVPEHTPLLWYLGVRACQAFLQQHQRYPGTIDNVDDDNDNKWESDIPLLQDCWTKVVQHYALEDQELLQSHATNICHELTRYANAEIHTVASVVGGVASQEGVKIITGQYIPLDNTYIFNGIVAVGGVYRF
jgi:amyloid beta precursor protein binding protein 1